MASTIAEQVGVAPVASGRRDEFLSTALPIRMGNALPIAYGGCALAVAVQAAARTVPEGGSHRLYSVVGHFHGPAALDRPFKCAVTRTRDTRTFATRRVRVSQLQKKRKSKEETTERVAGDSGVEEEREERVCLELIADFHAIEDALMTFSTSPLQSYEPPAACPTRRELQSELEARSGGTGKKIPVPFATMFEGTERFFEMRFCRGSMSGQNMGWAVELPTDQDALPLTSRSSAEWYRVLPGPQQQSLGQGSGSRDSHAAHCAALAFLMDGGLAFLPLVHSHRSFEESGAASSLDFALRVLTPDLDMGRWHVRERVAHAGGAGRSYAEGRFFDEQGRLVASMTQQGILRPASKTEAKASL